MMTSGVPGTKRSPLTAALPLRIRLAANGAASTAGVDAALSSSTTYFQNAAAGIPTGKISKSLMNAASLFDQFNNGTVGPGHCNE